MAKPVSNISKRILEGLEMRNLTQQELSKRTGISKSSISQYISGYAKPKSDRVHELSRALDVQETWLLGYDVPPRFQDDWHASNIIYPAAKPIPILGTICAGNGVWCEENYEGTFFIDKSIKADMCLRVKGDSMIEAGIDDGDYIFIKKVYDYEDGKIYAVLLEDSTEAVIKKIKFEGENIILSPCNAEYQPFLKPLKDISIIGECVGTYHAI